MENREGGTATTACRIRWTDALMKSLVDIAAKAEPTKRGFHARLQEMWYQAHPTMPSRGSTLACKLHRIYKSMPEPEPESDPETEAMEVTEHSSDLSNSAAKKQEWKKELRKAHGKMCALDPQDALSHRNRLIAKWCSKHKQQIYEIDKAMSEIWEEGGREEGNGDRLWSFNCLLYVGAEMVIKQTKNPASTGDSEEVEEAENLEAGEVESPEADSDMEIETAEDHDDLWEGLAPTDEVPQPECHKNDIRKLRQSIGWLEATISQMKGQGAKKQRTKRKAILRAKVRSLVGRGKLELKQLLAMREKLKSLLQIKVLKRRRRKVIEMRKKQNLRMAAQGPKSLNKKPSHEVAPDMVDQIASFWKGIWESQGAYLPHHPAISAWQTKLREQTKADPSDEPPDRELAWLEATKKLSNWKAPGPDGIPGYWIKAFHRMQSHLKTLLWEILNREREVPQWLIWGRTVLIPKEGYCGKPDQFRPITCLNTIYKLLTGVLAKMLMKHVEQKVILPPEQKALRKRTRGCLDALVIDGAVAAEAKACRRNLSVAWIDYRKAFDMIPHKWIKRVLKAIRAPKEVRRTIKGLIPNWRTDLWVRTTEGQASIEIHLKRGIYQGDSLSPLLFCLCVAPLSHALNQGKGFESAFLGKLTHLMFVDDLKVYNESKKELTETVEVVENVSTALGMTLGLPKCAIAHAERGKVVEGGGSIPLATGGTIAEVEYGGTYKYLGVNQLFGSALKKTKERVKQEYILRLRKTWGSELNARNMAKAHNTWAAAVLGYFFGAIRWNRSNLLELDRKTRRIIRQNQCHHINASLERLYLPRKEGGRGLVNVELAWEREAVSCSLYLLGAADPQVQGALSLQVRLAEMGHYSFLRDAQEVLDKYDLPYSLNPEQETPPVNAVKAQLREAQLKSLRLRLEAKKLHGVFIKQTLGEKCDREATHAWLKDGRLRATTESLIVAAQDGVTYTAAYRARILKESISQKCRACEKGAETLGHILSSCEHHKWGLYKTRHDRVLYQLVKAVAQSLKIEIPKSLRAPGGVIKAGIMGPPEKRLLIDQAIPTVRETTDRRPDLIVRLKEQKKVVIFEVACAWDAVVEERESQKRGKYLELAADLAHQWPGYKPTVIPVVIGDLGLIGSLRRNLMKAGFLTKEAISKVMQEMQRETLCGAVRIIRRHMTA